MRVSIFPRPLAVRAKKWAPVFRKMRSDDKNVGCATVTDVPQRSLEHRAKKWEPVFRNQRCDNKDLERATASDLTQRALRQLARDTRGVSLIEFAFALPLLLTAGLGGIELANIAITHMRINQIAVSLADNASRMKQETVNGAPRIREYDVNQAFIAADHQAKGLDLKGNGRLILSNLKKNESGGQYIQWQRCQGDKRSEKSAYGAEGVGKTGTAFPGMGPTGHEVRADTGAAIIVAEVVYDYSTIVPLKFFGDLTIRKFAAMTVRDDRDLSEPGIFNPSPAVTKSAC